MKRILVPLQELKMPAATTTTNNAPLHTRLQENVDSLQSQFDDIISQAMQTKIILEQLAQGNTGAEVYTTSNNNYETGGVIQQN